MKRKEQETKQTIIAEQLISYLDDPNKAFLQTSSVQ